MIEVNKIFCNVTKVFSLMSCSEIKENEVINVNVGNNETVSLSFSNTLDQLDKLFLDAAYSIFKSGEKSFTAKDILQITAGTNKVNKTSVEQVEKSIKILRQTLFTLQYCAHYKLVHKKELKTLSSSQQERILKSCRISSNLLVVDSIEEENKTTYFFKSMSSEISIPLHFYAEQVKQLICFDSSAISCINVVQTKTAMLIENYILKRLSSHSLSNTILLNTMLDNLTLEITSRVQRARLIKLLSDILCDLQKANFIDSFQFVTSTRNRIEKIIIEDTKKRGEI